MSEPTDHLSFQRYTDFLPVETTHQDLVNACRILVQEGYRQLEIRKQFKDLTLPQQAYLFLLRLLQEEKRLLPEAAGEQSNG